MNNLEEFEAEQKKKRRLARNRESARECRKRKKEYGEALRAQLIHLEAENLQLRLKLKIGVDRSKHNGDQSALISSRLNTMLEQECSDADIKKEIEELQEKYSDYGRDRKSSIVFHISQLRKCLLPTQTTRTLLWLMSCAPMFHDRDGNEKVHEKSELSALWKDLLSELSPSSEQKKKLVDFSADENSPFPVLQKKTEDSNRLLDRLDELVSTKHDTLDNVINKLHGVLNARQIARFILWIDKNPATMQMLEMIWPHIQDFTTSAKEEDDARGHSGVDSVEMSKKIEIKTESDLATASL